MSRLSSTPPPFQEERSIDKIELLDRNGALSLVGRHARLLRGAILGTMNLPRIDVDRSMETGPGVSHAAGCIALTLADPYPGD